MNVFYLHLSICRPERDKYIMYKKFFEIWAKIFAKILTYADFDDIIPVLRDIYARLSAGGKFQVPSV